VLITALRSKEFGVLSMYLGGVKIDKDDTFVCEMVQYENKCIPDLKLGLQDYFFNEPESKKLWELSLKLLGRKFVDLSVVKAFEF
jgi:hypothetical protein